MLSFKGAIDFPEGTLCRPVLVKDFVNPLKGTIEFPEGTLCRPFLVKDLVTPFKGAIDFPEGTLCRPLLVNQQLSCTTVCSSSTVLVERCLKDARKTL